jgi:hypothetical protein
MKTHAELPASGEAAHGRRRTREGTVLFSMPTKKPASKKVTTAPKAKPVAAKKELPTPKLGTLAEGDVAPDFSLDGAARRRRSGVYDGGQQPQHVHQRSGGRWNV